MHSTEKAQSATIHQRILRLKKPGMAFSHQTTAHPCCQVNCWLLIISFVCMKYFCSACCLTHLLLHFRAQEHLESRWCHVQESWASRGLITECWKIGQVKLEQGAQIWSKSWWIGRGKIFGAAVFNVLTGRIYLAGTSYFESGIRLLTLRRYDLSSCKRELYQCIFTWGSRERRCY